MSDYEFPVTVSSVRHEFGTFFDRVRLLYNLAFFKEEKGYRAEAVKKYADEMFEANRISEYVTPSLEKRSENSHYSLRSN